MHIDTTQLYGPPPPHASIKKIPRGQLKLQGSVGCDQLQQTAWAV